MSEILRVRAKLQAYRCSICEVKVCYCFVAMSLRILHVNVAEHPTSAWAAHWLLEVFPADEVLQRGRDRAYVWAFWSRVKAPGVAELVKPARSPWQNAYVGRVIGSFRRKRTDPIILIGEKHLLRTIHEYVADNNEVRSRQAPDGTSPVVRSLKRKGEVTSKSVLGHLHRE